MYYTVLCLAVITIGLLFVFVVVSWYDKFKNKSGKED